MVNGFAEAQGKLQHLNRHEKIFNKLAISKAWELENKPGRSSVTKTVSMIDNHRSQIASSEGGSVDSVLGRHKKVKQSVGDSMKLAMLPNQPPPDPQIQQEWRGRPKKMKDTTNVAGTMDHTSSMLSASTASNSG